MQQPPAPILDYNTQRPAIATIAWQSVAAIVGGMFIPAFMCICGHLDRLALIATVPVATLAWCGFARRLSLGGRVLAACVAALASVALIKNLLDIAWFGHNPLLK